MVESKQIDVDGRVMVSYPPSCGAPNIRLWRTNNRVAQQLGAAGGVVLDDVIKSLGRGADREAPCRCILSRMSNWRSTSVTSRLIFR
jgi:uncharacterized protein YbbK (DUF523 family)